MSTDSTNLYRLRPGTVEEAPYSPAPRRPVQNDAEISTRRIWVALALFAIFGIVLLAQLVRYQAFGAVPKVNAGSGSGILVDPLLPRGSILDREGHPLALESYVYNVIADPTNIKYPAKIAAELAPLLAIDAREIEDQLILGKEAGSHNLELIDNIDAEIGETIMAKDYYTVTAVSKPVRYYPEGSLACHVLGFVAQDRVGYYGIEGFYDDFLRASTRVARILDVPRPANTPSDHTVSTDLPASPFVPSYIQQDVILTIDRAIQYMAETELQNAIEEHDAESGVIIIIEPETSALLAMASWPAFNPNDHVSVDSLSTYVNPTTSALYEPGSVFKLITFAAALDEGVIEQDTRYLDEDEFIFGQRKIQNWDRKGRGVVPASYALAQSLNVTTAKIAVDLGATRFYRAVKRFGFDQITGIELEGEVPGIVKSPGKEGWYPADLATNAFGQGISVTPLQMANAVAAIAADGIVHRAHVVHQIIDGEELRTTEPQAQRRAVSAETAEKMTRLMVYTVEETPKAKIPGYAIAGKSGTAEIPLPDGYKDEYTIASFVGFLPADDPQFVVLVKLDRPKTDRWATHTAAPVFRTVARNLIQLHAIPPDDVRLGVQTSMPDP
ncbi:MAG: penicillin-binding protein 2 [Chloroflexi bacterium]|nr:penicillin-binding protein 2 [Chloroflexota bacterium]